MLRCVQFARPCFPLLVAACLLAVVSLRGGASLPLGTQPAPAGNLADALQDVVDRAMAGRSGAVVVADVESGRMLAQHRIDIAARRRVLPGSAVKPFTLRALLEAQAIRPGTTLLCPLKLQLRGHRMDCSHPAIPVPIDAASALAYSCNNYFAHFAARLTDAQLDQAFARAGLTSTSGMAPDEVAAQVRPASSPEHHSLKALGAADVFVTPLGLLNAYRRLALLRRQGSPDESLATVFDGLEASVTRGMARAARVDGLAVAGKTGTAGADEGSWTHAWFAGYAPAEKPEIVLVVFLERGTGAADASPVAKQILEAFARAQEKP